MGGYNLARPVRFGKTSQV